MRERHQLESEGVTEADRTREQGSDMSCREPGKEIRLKTEEVYLSVSWTQKFAF